jgi:hypothetical protein
MDKLFVEPLHLRKNALLFYLAKRHSHSLDVSAQPLFSRQAAFL